MISILAGQMLLSSSKDVRHKIQIDNKERSDRYCSRGTLGYDAIRYGGTSIALLI